MNYEHDAICNMELFVFRKSIQLWVAVYTECVPILNVSSTRLGAGAWPGLV